MKTHVHTTLQASEAAAAQTSEAALQQVHGTFPSNEKYCKEDRENPISRLCQKKSEKSLRLVHTGLSSPVFM